MVFPTKEMINLNISWYMYLLWSFVLSLMVRAILCVWRAWLPKAEEAAKNGEWDKIKYWKRYLASGKGFGKTFGIDVREQGDYWLSYLIGVAELLAYPILFRFDQVGAIGGWIALKTVGNWGVWQKRRNAFLNLLWGNILIIVGSYFWMTRFIDP